MEETSMPTSIDSPTFIANVAVKLPVDLKKNASLIGFQGFAEFVVDQSIKTNSVYNNFILILLFPKSLHKGDTFSPRPKDRNVRAFTTVSTEPKRKVDSKRFCHYCREAHKLEECREFQTLSIKERKLFGRSSRIFFKCLTVDHMVKDCLAESHCAKPGCMSQFHHTLLHFDNLSIKPAVVSENAASSDAPVVSAGHCLHSVLPSCKQVNVPQRAACK